MMIINNNNNDTNNSNRNSNGNNNKNNNNGKLHKNCVFFILQKQPTRGISRKRYSENLSKIDEK